MNSWLKCYRLTLSQLGQPFFTKFLILVLFISIGVFLAVWGLCTWILIQLSLVPWVWLEWTLTVLGSLGVFVLSLFLFPTFVTVFSSLFAEPLITAIEGHFYPQLGPPLSVPWKITLGLAVRFLLSSVVIAVVILVTFWIPVIGLVGAVFLNGYLLGREYFEMVAIRRIPLNELTLFRQRFKRPIFAYGVSFAVLSLVPGLNLLVPVLATSVLTHAVTDWVKRNSA